MSDDSDTAEPTRTPLDLGCDEELQVYRMRCKRLLQAGLDDASAVDAALSDLDLHEFEDRLNDLLARGCPIEFALKIAV